MKTPSLSLQLSETARGLQHIIRGGSIDPFLEALPQGVRPGVQALTYYTLRHLALGQALTQQLLKKKPPIAIESLLWVSLILLAAQLDESSQGNEERDYPIYKPFVLVNESVNAVKANLKTKAFAPLINGVLRRFQREHTTLLNRAKQSEEVRWGFQQWWIDQVKNDWPEHWEKILEALQQSAPMALRVNAKWGAPLAALEHLAKQGISAIQTSAYGVELDEARPVEKIDGFEQGFYSVQATAAQWAAPLLLDRAWITVQHKKQGRPLQVLDACAAPGGKTAHLWELMSADEVEITAVDISAERLQLVQQNLDRVGRIAKDTITSESAMVHLLLADAADPATFDQDKKFDLILLDAPCTASGIVRRHPDIRWLRRESDIVALSQQQQRLLTSLWDRLTLEGRLLYATCSIFKKEGERVIERFMQDAQGVKKLKSPGHLLPLNLRSRQSSTTHELPADAQKVVTATDGFYYALLEK